MKYLLQKYYGDEYNILNDDADSVVADVRLLGFGVGDSGYRVRILTPETNGEYHQFIIKSINEAIPAVAAYYDANPPRWEPESDRTPHYSNMGPCRARYIKDTQFGTLWVDQIELGQWVAYRDGHELLSDGGKIAVFATCEEAQRAGDAHFRDGYPNSETINDGLSWPGAFNWQTEPYRAARRAELAVL